MHLSGVSPSHIKSLKKKKKKKIRKLKFHIVRVILVYKGVFYTEIIFFQKSIIMIGFSNHYLMKIRRNYSKVIYAL